jgi:hypothetical protein
MQADTSEMKEAYQKSGLAPKKNGKVEKMPKDGKPAGAGGLSGFWKFAILFSFLVNIILVFVLIVLGMLIFQIKNNIASPLIGGLYNNFVLMDQAHIITTIQVHDFIQVNDTIPVVFDLPLKQDTAVILTQDTPIQNATIFLNGSPIAINIVLPKGTPLNINLDMTVPVSKTIPIALTVPVNLTVPVDIELAKTNLDEPFKNLAKLVEPYKLLLDGLPSSWGEIPGFIFKRR